MATIYQPYTLKEGQLFINNKLIDLPAPIKQVKLINNLIIYCLKVTSGKECNRNIGALTYSGEQKWLVPEIRSQASFKHFVKISTDEQGRLIAHNSVGPTYIINTETGSLTSHGFEK